MAEGAEAQARRQFVGHAAGLANHGPLADGRPREAHSFALGDMDNSARARGLYPRL